VGGSARRAVPREVHADDLSSFVLQQVGPARAAPAVLERRGEPVDQEHGRFRGHGHRLFTSFVGSVTTLTAISSHPAAALLRPTALSTKVLDIFMNIKQPTTRWC